MHVNAVFNLSEVAYYTSLWKFNAFAYFCSFTNNCSVEDGAVGYVGFCKDD